MTEEIQKSRQATIELDHEKVSFITSDGELFTIQMKTILEKGDTNAALAYANLFILRTLAERQADLASAVNDLAAAFRGLTSNAMVGSSEEVVDKMMGKLNQMLSAAGMRIPTPPGG